MKKKKIGIFLFSYAPQVESFAYLQSIVKA